MRTTCEIRGFTSPHSLSCGWGERNVPRPKANTTPPIRSYVTMESNSVGVTVLHRAAVGEICKS